MTTDETIVLRALELGLELAEEKLADEQTRWSKGSDLGKATLENAERDVRDIKYAIRLVEAWK